MRRDRRFIAKVAALVLAVAAIVVPVTIATAAPEKIFDLNDESRRRSRPDASNVTVTATFKNATPSGNSTINSLRLFAIGRPGRHDHQRHRLRHGNRRPGWSLGVRLRDPPGEARQDLRTDDETHDTGPELVLRGDHHVERISVHGQLLQR